MRRLFLAFGLCFLAACATQADSTTSRIGLTKPDIGSSLWGTKLNADMDVIDSSVACLSQTNTFTGINNFLPINVKSGNALGLYNSNNTAATLFSNPGSSGQSQLNLISPDGIGVNNSAISADADLLVYGGTNQSYGRFALIGSSANATAAYSGFTATAPISQSTLWSLPAKDGTSGQSLQTDGSGHLSFAAPTAGLWTLGSGSPAGCTINGIVTGGCGQSSNSLLIQNLAATQATLDTTGSLSVGGIGPARFNSVGTSLNGSGAYIGTSQNYPLQTTTFFQVASSTTTTYEALFSTSATGPYHVAISTSGGLGFYQQTKAQLQAYAPKRTGESFFCSDCTTAVLCIASGTATNQFYSSTSRATGCQ